MNCKAKGQECLPRSHLKHRLCPFLDIRLRSFSAAWHEYLNVELLKLTSRHVSGCLILIGGFWLVGVTAEHMVPSGYILEYIEACEKTVIIAGVSWLTIFVLWELGIILVKLLRGQKFIAI